MADGGEFPGWRIRAEELLGKLPRLLQVKPEDEHPKELEMCRRLLTEGYNEADASALGWGLVADATVVETTSGYKDSLSAMIDETSKDEGSSTLDLLACVRLRLHGFQEQCASILGWKLAEGVVVRDAETKFEGELEAMVIGRLQAIRDELEEGFIHTELTRCIKMLLREAPYDD